MCLYANISKLIYISPYSHLSYKGSILYRLLSTLLLSLRNEPGHCSLPEHRSSTASSLALDGFWCYSVTHKASTITLYRCYCITDADVRVGKIPPNGTAVPGMLVHSAGFSSGSIFKMYCSVLQRSGRTLPGWVWYRSPEPFSALVKRSANLILHFHKTQML